ncbi:MAG TPA: hypothetical protein ENJ26_00355 [Rhodobacteraceae bacterium]|nr:hypothetical protein [Paracoccaceae bacterium]
MWSDAPNYYRGHWINGRTNARSLASVVAEICERSGAENPDVSGLFGVVRGYSVDSVSSARSALQPLLLAYGAEAVEREGKLQFRNRTGLASATVDEARVVFSGASSAPVEHVRAAQAEMAGRLRLSFVDADGDYETRSEDAVFPDGSAEVVSASEFPLLLTRTEGRAITERWLAQSRVARDGLRIALPPSRQDIGAGDVIALDAEGRPVNYRVDRVTLGDAQVLEAVRVEPEQYRPSDAVNEPAEIRPFAPPTPVFPLFLDLPLLRGNEVEHAPHLAVAAYPWPGAAAVYSASSDANYSLNTLVNAPATVGVTSSTLLPAKPAVLDNSAPLRVTLSSGTLSSVAFADVLNGANVAAIGDGTPGRWEVFQFTEAQLVSPGVYDLSGRLRGQAGTDHLAEDIWPAGSYFVLLDPAVPQISLNAADRGLSRHYRIGPAGRPVDDPSYSYRVEAFDGIGLRPLSPVHLRAEVLPSNDIALSWVRRTRIDGDSWQSVEVPLGEDTELYKIRVVQNGAVVRQETATQPNWTYAASAQMSDGVASPFTIEVAQVSNRFGPGIFRKVDL